MKLKNAADQIGYPCVIKAPDSSASRGIVRANKINDIEKAFNKLLYTLDLEV